MTCNDISQTIGQKVGRHITAPKKIGGSVVK